MPYPNEHALRLKSPGIFDKDSFRRTAGGSLYGGAVKVPGTIGMIWAKLSGKSKPSDPPILQALRFKKTSWTVTAAKAWIKKNIKQTGTFEPASTSATEQSDNYDPSEDVIWGDDEQYDGGTELSEDDLLLMSEEGDGETADGVQAQAEAQAQAQAQEEQLMTDSEEDGETADEGSSTDSGAKDPDGSEYAEDIEEDDDDENDEDDQETYTVEDVELFSAGTWKGDKYTTDDLDQIVVNFALLRQTIKPPFVLGHGDQALLRASGLPAAGWVTKLRRVGKKLIADIAEAPRAVYNLIKKKAYKRISCEIYQNYQDSKGKRHGLALARVAILGGDIPAVKTLKDIEALYADNTHDNEIRTVTYTMPETKETLDKKKEIEDEETEETPGEEENEETAEEEEEEEEETSEEETQEDTSNDTEKDKTEQSTQSDTELVEKIKALEGIVKAQDVKIASIEEESARQLEEAAVVKDEAFLDKLTEAGTFPPALREKSLLLMSAYRQETGILKYTEKVDEKDVEMESTAYDIFTNILETLPTMIEMSELGTSENKRPGSGGSSTGKEDKQYKHIDGYDVKDVEIADAADKYYEEHKADGITYSDALIKVQREV